MTPADDTRFENWLAAETGIDASSLGVNALSRAVQDRIAATQSPDIAPDLALDAYWRLLTASADERQALVETLVVPETWFFRDSEAFAALARLALERLAAAPSRVLRVLSAPCSSGEEPYSIAMALLDAGIDPSRFAIDAVDISGRAIEQAQRAVYGRNSFRGHALDFRARHFTEAADGWQLHARVQQTVRFARGNLFEPLRQGATRYDFVFCRNVLIYFHRDAQDRMIHLLDGVLADGGTIFVGPAETGLMMRHAMTSARIPLAFAFHRAPPAEAGAATRWRSAARPRPPAAMRHASAAGAAGAAGAASAATPAVAALDPLAVETLPVALRDAYTSAAAAAAVLAGASTTVASAPSMPVAPVAAAVSSAGRVERPFEAAHPAPAVSSAVAALVPEAGLVSPDATLADAQRFADAGRFAEAERIVSAFTHGHEPDADAFYLLGLIADARGQSAEAAEFYRKALYLAPAHYEALTHLAVLLDMSGDAAGAQQMASRAQRAVARRADAGPGGAKSS